MAVRNGENDLAEKLQNLQELDYPADLVEIVVVSDGSTDRTNEILSDFRDSSVRSILLPEHVGKAEALNRAVEMSSGDIVVFMDVRQRVAVDSVKRLVENFADARVGCVSGELMLSDGEESTQRGVGSYWKIEKAIRQWESASGSVVGATGAIYAVRRSLVPQLPAGLILDDVFIPMEVVRRGARVIFEPRALAWDHLPARPQQEFRRKVRTLFGNYQLLRFCPWLLSARNPIRFEFISHKLCRLAVPFALIAAMVASGFLPGMIYRLPLVAALGIGMLGVLAFLRLPLGVVSRVTDLALAFVLLEYRGGGGVRLFCGGKEADMGALMVPVVKLEWSFAMDAQRTIIVEQALKSAVKRPNRREPLAFAYFGLILFMIVYFARPEDWMPGFGCRPACQNYGRFDSPGTGFFVQPNPLAHASGGYFPHAVGGATLARRYFLSRLEGRRRQRDARFLQSITFGYCHLRCSSFDEQASPDLIRASRIHCYNRHSQYCSPTHKGGAPAGRPFRDLRRSERSGTCHRPKPSSLLGASADAKATGKRSLGRLPCLR